MNKTNKKILELRKMAEKGSDFAQYELGYLYSFGIDVKQDMSEAVKWWALAAEQGHYDAKNALGECYASGDGVEKNMDEAIRLWNDSLRNNPGSGSFLENKCRHQGKTPETADFEFAKWIREQAKQGNIDAQYYLGSGIHWYSIYVDDTRRRNELKNVAVKWWLKAAKQGHPGATHWLATCYDRGIGVIPDFAEAAKWLLKLATMGYSDAQLRMGWYYDWGRGVPRNHAEAVKWWLKAAENDSFTAEYELGESYAKGAGVKEDKEEALKWFRKSAEHGNEHAQEMLDRIDKEGFESVQNELKAYMKQNETVGGEKLKKKSQ